MTIGSKIRVGSVEGNTDTKGSKQNKEYTLIEESKIKGFWDAVDQKGKKYTLWFVEGFSKPRLGICKFGVMRYSYTTNFEII